MVGPFGGTTVRLVQLQLANECRSADVTTDKNLLTDALKLDTRGWMPENYLGSRAGRSVFS